MQMSLSLKVAITTFFIAGSGVLLISMLSYAQIREYTKESILNSLKYELDGGAKQLNQEIEGMIKDVQILANNEYIRAIYKLKNNEDSKKRLGKTFKSILEHNEAYFNIKLIDVSGRELVVALKDSKDKVFILKDDFLQNKHDRPYFKETITLKKDDIYISKINLNREYRSFSKSHIPTIRIASPIYIDEKIVAILIVNANINKLFSIINSHIFSDNSIYIANSDGYYLYNKDSSKTFGFDLNKEDKIYDIFKKGNDSYFQGNQAFAKRKVYIDTERYLILALVVNDEFLKEQSKAFEENLVMYILIIALGIAFFSLVFVRFLISPVIELTRQAKNIASGDMSETKEFELVKSNDEIGSLSKSLRFMLKHLQNSKQEIEKKVEERTKELHDLNENLERIVKEKTQENIKQLEIMQAQNKMASMGEMIGAIAHQWRQPLNEISISIQNLKYDYEDGLIDKEFLEAFIDKNKNIIAFMSSTIDDFRNFYRVDKSKELFDVKEAIEKTLSLQEAQLTHNNITVTLSGDSFEVYGFRNEFLQVILNIITNAKDALLEQKVKNAKIVIKLDKRSITIKDNAGGISDENLERIFQPYFTTKKAGKGTGMGLYMSKMIIEENIHANLSVKNIEDGAEFRMDFNEI